MRTTLPIVLVFALAACTNAGPTSDGGGGNPDSGGGGNADMALDAGDVVINMTSFTVPAGGEVFKCQNFANPYGVDTEIREFDSHMAAGSHHMLVFYKANATNDPIQDCSGLEFSAGPYGAQVRDSNVTYPDGVAALIPANQGLRLSAHYLNATQQPITATVQLILHKAKAGTITDHAGVFFFNNIDILIPATNAPVTITKTCVAPQDMTILYSTGHVHQHATNLTAMVDGQMMYSTDSWDASPFKQFAPPMQVKKGASFTFTCTYVNKTGTPLVFGESALSNEMCIFDGQYYPNPSGQGVYCM